MQGVVKDIQGLLFEDHLLIDGKVLRNGRVRAIGDEEHAVGSRLGNHFRAGRADHAVRRELLELRIIWGVNAGVADDEHAAVAGRVCQTGQIRDQPLRAWDVQLPAGQNEIRLRVDIPKNR